MAEPTPSPVLPSTADPTPYVPVSWLAVAALGVAVLFAVLLLVLGGIAFTSHKPLLMEELLVLPVVAVVLSFAARRAIRNSEGTRTGETLAGAAWWVALVLGLCYWAYLFAVGFAIRRDARGEVERWVGYLNRGDEEGVTLAFYRTLPPGARQGINPNDPRAMQLRFRDELLLFRNSDLVKLAQRNKGGLEFKAGSVTWEYRPGGVDSALSGVVKCPEGTFPVTVSLKGYEGMAGAEGGGGRQWAVERPRGGGFVDQARTARTRYGWTVLLLEAAGGGYGREYVAHLAAGPGGHAYAYRAYVAEKSEPRQVGPPPRERPQDRGWAEVARTPLLQLAFAAPVRVAGDAGYADYRENRFFALANGAAPPPDRKEQFFNAFDRAGLRPAGDRLKGVEGNVIDKEDSITVTDSAVEVRVPVEIPLPGTGGKVEAARGRLLVECRDPAILAELKQLKAAANPDDGTAFPPDDVLSKMASWRVVRVESDMAPVSVGPPPGQGGPGGMPGMPGG